MIAAAAEANIALVGRYFGSKAGLFAAVLQGEPTFGELFTGRLGGAAPPAGRVRGPADAAAAGEPDPAHARTFRLPSGGPDGAGSA
ncbi:hypothetical protein GCM10020220_054240 [Nonomuraea rubra]|uniref:hypothetical protein n=1 Tax=Nonomuraea rubra TaxID=46180 RepID=UPI0031EEAFE2